MAYPFCPMTDKILKKLSRIAQDTDQTINSHDHAAVFVSQELKFILELIPHPTETNQSDISTDNLI